MKVQYKGFDFVILNENYKCIEAVSITIRFHIDGFRESIKHVGLVMTFSKWETTRWLYGPENPTEGYTRGIMDPYKRMVKRKRYNPGWESEWFYDGSSNGLVDPDGDVAFKLIIPMGWAPYTGDIDCKYSDRDRSLDIRECSKEKLWFAVFAESDDGSMVWDNNGGWNYEIDTDMGVWEWDVRHENNEERQKKKQPYLLKYENRGWEGS